MRIAIIGGGVTGLTAAYGLTKNGHDIHIFEKEPYLGGLAYGFRAPHWDWHLEGAYHHLFTNDTAILSLSRELGLQKNILTIRPVTASLWKGKPYQLDSPSSLLTFPGLSIPDKFRTAVLLAILKLTPLWQPLEYITAETLTRTIGGNEAFRVIWEPLLYGKFGAFAPKVSAAWFWARIKKRTPSLVYFRGGFHSFVTALEHAIKKRNGLIHTNTSVSSIQKTSKGFVVTWGTHKKTFDAVLLTTPTLIAKTIAPQLLSAHCSLLSHIPHLHAQTLILETDKPILKHVYWLNITDTTYPFLAAVAHTNFVDAKYYGGNHITYFGNYLPQDHPYLSMTKEQLLKQFNPFIKRLSPTSHYSLLSTHMFVGPFAQPVHTRGYSTRIPPIQTPSHNLYMANMDYVVPWDRGTNYAVELGIKAATTIMNT